MAHLIQGALQAEENATHGRILAPLIQGSPRVKKRASQRRIMTPLMSRVVFTGLNHEMQNVDPFSRNFRIKRNE